MRLIKMIIPCLLLSGCFMGTSEQSKFYTQSAMATETLSADYTAFVGVNRIQLPKYVDRPQIVTQLKDSVQINISEYNRWVESPSVLATRVLVEDLTVLLPEAQIKINQFKGEGFDCTVSVEVTKINAVLDDKAELVAWYVIKDSSGKRHAHHKFAATVQIGKTYDDLVNGYGQLLTQLSREIARVLTEE